MIKNVEHAKAVQARRMASGKNGTAKAVRRFYIKLAPNKYEAYKSLAKLAANFTGCRTFNETHYGGR